MKLDDRLTNLVNQLIQTYRKEVNKPVSRLYKDQPFISHICPRSQIKSLRKNVYHKADVTTILSFLSNLIESTSKSSEETQTVLNQAIEYMVEDCDRFRLILDTQSDEIKTLLKVAHANRIRNTNTCVIQDSFDFYQDAPKKMPKTGIGFFRIIYPTLEKQTRTVNQIFKEDYDISYTTFMNLFEDTTPTVRTLDILAKLIFIHDPVYLEGVLDYGYSKLKRVSNMSHYYDNDTIRNVFLKCL